MSYQPIPEYTAEQLDAMTERQLRTYEARLRRAIARRGLRLERSRRRDPGALDYGVYRIVDGTGGGDYGMSLGDVAAWINDEARR